MRATDLPPWCKANRYVRRWRKNHLFVQGRCGSSLVRRLEYGDAVNSLEVTKKVTLFSSFHKVRRLAYVILLTFPVARDLTPRPSEIVNPSPTLYCVKLYLHPFAVRYVQVLRFSVDLLMPRGILQTCRSFNPGASIESSLFPQYRSTFVQAYVCSSVF